jgi:hypothetical protein
LIQAQKLLFEAFIKLIAGAIDAKSSHTGGHCARVPELAKMLAHAVCAQTSGPYRDFSLSEDDWEAVHVAAWLHDCGKITTPEYVVNKATRLETLYDRIHEIRMRFEVLKRDAEIACLKAIASGEPEFPAPAQNFRRNWHNSTTTFPSLPPVMRAKNSWHRQSWRASTQSPGKPDCELLMTGSVSPRKKRNARPAHRHQMYL